MAPVVEQLHWIKKAMPSVRFCNTRGCVQDATHRGTTRLLCRACPRAVTLNLVT